MNFYAINTIWTRVDGRMSQQMTIAWSPSEALAIETHMNTCKQDPEKISLIARDVVKADKNFLEVVYKDMVKDHVKHD